MKLLPSSLKIPDCFFVQKKMILDNYLAVTKKVGHAELLRF